jgi:hypothetical protein
MVDSKGIISVIDQGIPGVRYLGKFYHPAVHQAPDPVVYFICGKAGVFDKVLNRYPVKPAHQVFQRLEDPDFIFMK